MINCQAPEIVKNSLITDKSVVYSLGMVLIEMLSLEIPFNEIHSQIKLREKIIDGYKPLTIDKINDPSIITLLEKLLEYEAKNRPSIQELISSEFLKINEKEDNRIVPIIKLKKKIKRVSHLRNSSNYMINNNYITTPYQSAVPDDYLMSSSNLVNRQNTRKDLNITNESVFKNQNTKLNQRSIKKNLYNSNQNNFLLNNNLSNININNTMYNIHDLSSEKRKRPGICNMSKKINRKKLLLFKHNFKENPYFEESLKMKIENELENSQNNINLNDNYIYQPIQTNKEKLDFTTQNTIINKDPMCFLNQNNLTTNEQIKEYLNNKSNNVNKKDRTSIELDANYDIKINKNSTITKDLDLLSGLDNNFEKRNNNDNITCSNDNLIHVSDFTQNYFDNISAVQSNYNRETLYNNSSQAHTNRNSNNNISCIIDNNLNYKSQNSNNVHISNENIDFKCHDNITPKSNYNKEIVYSKNRPKSHRDESSKNPNFIDGTEYIESCNNNQNKSKKNKSVSWLNFDNKIYEVIDNQFNNDLNSANKIENSNFDNKMNRQEKDLYLNSPIYSTENLNQIVEKVKSNNFDPIFSKYGLPDETKNDFNQTNFNNEKRKQSTHYNKDDDILNESNSNINNGFMKYSKDSSSMIDSDNLMDRYYDNNKNNLIINNLSYISSNKNIENIADNINSSPNINEINKKIKVSNSQGNLRSKYFENENVRLIASEDLGKRKCESTNNILYHTSNVPIINNQNQDFNLVMNELNFGEPIEKETQKSSGNNQNGFNSCYNIRNSSSDSLMHLRALDNRKDFAVEDQEYLKLANKDAAKAINEKNNGNNNNNLYNKPKYQIFDSNYDVHLKFMINQDSKIHEIQFTYNLLKDNIPDLMNEIQNEFNFSSENLNHIYETLKKISIYSKFYCNSDILHDNSF